MEPRQENIQIKNGTGAIEVRGNEEACGLFTYGKPFVLNWDEGGGSVFQEILYNAQAREEAVSLLRQFTLNGPEPGVSLEASLAPLLSYFAAGAYQLDFREIVPPTQLRESWARPGEVEEYYPLHYVLISTQPGTQTNQERVREYQAQMEQGHRPVVLTTTVKDAIGEFVLDGHHKIRAYHALNTPVTRLCLVALNPRPITVADWPGDAPSRRFVRAVDPQAFTHETI